MSNIYWKKVQSIYQPDCLNLNWHFIGHQKCKTQQHRAARYQNHLCWWAWPAWQAVSIKPQETEAASCKHRVAWQRRQWLPVGRRWGGCPQARRAWGVHVEQASGRAPARRLQLQSNAPEIRVRQGDNARELGDAPRAQSSQPRHRCARQRSRTAMLPR